MLKSRIMAKNGDASKYTVDLGSLDLAPYPKSTFSAAESSRSSHSDRVAKTRRPQHTPAFASSTTIILPYETRRTKSHVVPTVDHQQNFRHEKRVRSETDGGQLESPNNVHLQRVLECIRSKASDVDVFGNSGLDFDASDEGKRRSKTDKRCDVDGTASMHMMKVKLRMQENDLDKVTREAAFSLQEAEQKTVQTEALLKNVKNMKAHDAHQTQKLQQLVKQVQEAKNLVSHLEKEVERLTRANAVFDREEKADREKTSPEANSVNRLATINDTMKSDVQQFKDDNKVLTNGNQKGQQQLQEDRRRYQQECKRFVNLIHKMNFLLDLSGKEKDHLETSRMYQFTEDEIKRNFIN